MLYGIVLALSCLPPEKIRERLDIFLPHIDNWAVCDGTAASLRIIALDKDAFWDWIMRHRTDPEPFTIRFLICLLMDYYLDETHIDKVLEIFTGIRSEEYYVSMGLAWALCECLIRHYDKTLPVLTRKTLHPRVQNKTIQKSTESFRLTREQKQTLRSLKIKTG
jgi:3-methyladenine DNA glycosylase AlkD